MENNNIVYGQKEIISKGEYINVDEAPFKVYGVKKDEIGYYRMPRDVAASINDTIRVYAGCTAGGSVRFMTNSPSVAIKAETPVCGGLYNHMPPVGSFGFDMYEGTKFQQTFFPPLQISTFESSHNLYTEDSGSEWHDLTIFMPVLSSYKNLYVKVPEGYVIKSGGKYRNEKPVVFYGSSITHGSCSGKPGSNYVNLLSRGLNMYCVNLGFAGAAKAEKPMVDYLASLDMEVFVLDYDHNAPDAEYLRETHRPLFEAVREKHPDIPIIIASAVPFIYENGRCADERRRVIYETYESAVRSGDKNVYFLNGCDFFKEVPYDYCTLDGIHPNDVGYYMMYKGFKPTFEEIFKKLNK